MPYYGVPPPLLIAVRSMDPEPSSMSHTQKVPERILHCTVPARTSLDHSRMREATRLMSRDLAIAVTIENACVSLKVYAA